MEYKKFFESFTIAGVTFEGRQELIRQLQPNQIIFLEREPWNIHDPAAVRVIDLRGRSLGYVPRREGLNARFTYEGAFGLVASAGPVMGSSHYGAHIYARPGLTSLLLDPMVLPAADAAHFADLPAVFGDRWAAARAATLAAANYRCEATGVGQAQLPLQLIPHWRYNARDKAVQMTRVLALCQPLVAAKERLEQGVAAVAEHGAEEAADALRELQGTPEGRMFTEINGLADEDVVQYFELVRRRSHSLKEEKWKIEVLL